MSWSKGLLVVIGVCMTVCGILYMETVSYHSVVSTFRAVFNAPECRPCQEQTNIVFIKVHKAGGSTVSTIFQRFGDDRNLSFVLPRKGINLGWPNQIKRRDFLPSLTGEYNILVRHVVYNRRILPGIMAKNTVYIAILREPFSHLKSVFNFYHLGKKLRIPSKDPVLKFLNFPRRYLRKSAHPQKTKNFMSFDLGFPVKRLSGNSKAISDFIRQTDKDFLLVMILEYLDESLVLLKRYLCWSLSDILYWVQNQRKYKRKDVHISLAQKKTHQKFSNVDFAYYEYFNATLWKKIELQGPDFWKEVQHFKAIQSDVMEFCQSPQSVVNTRVINASMWNEEFYVDAAFCAKLRTLTLSYLNFLRKKYSLQQNSKASVGHNSTTKKSHCFPGTNKFP
ncbi:galactose-3-O-sulfotransferase 3-like isoform X2 [Branchiostoma lanceolatum]|uniref:galactose-3-O-sulfotransferase 3-like isoform X2 n=1 Tax=Branchiostoma lanceolatum TaxID=7740 RepID=UPI003453202C